MSSSGAAQRQRRCSIAPKDARPTLPSVRCRCCVWMVPGSSAPQRLRPRSSASSWPSHSSSAACGAGGPAVMQCMVDRNQEDQMTALILQSTWRHVRTGRKPCAQAHARASSSRTKSSSLRQKSAAPRLSFAPLWPTSRGAARQSARSSSSSRTSSACCRPSQHTPEGRTRHRKVTPPVGQLGGRSSSWPVSFASFTASKILEL
mmetsp:Transcript_98771/g.318559  ORF Transcript_98771/g.318559 Transcript_98771/m.318559 type:complete len:204 (+) Transcript_98771:540-1151(+)